MFDADQIMEHAALGLRKAETATSTTRFGGHPNLAADIDWPHDSAGRPMHHLLQLDCAALPFVDPDMPRTGTLLFFITGSYEENGAPSLEDADKGAYAVIYQDADAASTPVRPHPLTCPALGDKSYAINPVRHALPTKKPGFFQRLVNTQPKPYSGSGGTGYFNPVPLEAVTFDSSPTSDAQAVFDAFPGQEYSESDETVLRPFQVLGYSPTVEDLKQALAEGSRTCSDEKALAAYEKGLGRDEVLLAQFVHYPALNLDLVSRDYVVQFRITRADLRARAFGKTHAVFAELERDGLWWQPAQVLAPYTPDAEELLPQVALKPLTPFEVPSAPSNYFCGAPQMPADLEWPHTRSGYPLGFLMQVDCASLPRSVVAGGQTLGLPAFPQTGTLFVFAYDYLDDMDGDSFKVLYTAEDTAQLPARIPPEALKTLPEFAPYNIKQRSRPGEVPRPEPKRPFEPVGFPFLVYSGFEELECEAKQQFRLSYGGVLSQEENAFEGVELIMDRLPNYTAAYFGKHMRAELSHASTPFRNIPESYPWRWGDIVTATHFFPNDEHGFARPEHRDAIFGEDVIAQGEEWKAKAAAHDVLDRIPDADRAAYRNWLLDMDAGAANIPAESAKESNADYRRRVDMEFAFRDIMARLARPYPYPSYASLPDTLHYLAYDDTADDLPDEMREVVAEMVRFHRSDTQLRGKSHEHRASPDLMFAEDDEQRNSDTEILLFSLASGSGLPVMWGDCCRLNVWIEADDLAAGRFDNIRTTIRW